VVLELVEVEFDRQDDGGHGDVLNVNEEGSFRVKITNNGLMNLLNVTLEIKTVGDNGALVKTGGGGVDYGDEFITGEIEKVNGDGGSELVPPSEQSKFRFKAPSDHSDQQVVELFKAVLHDWNADLKRILNAHTDPLPTVKVTYAKKLSPTRLRPSPGWHTPVAKGAEASRSQPVTPTGG
jgi:hypothetical protein